VLPDAEAKDLCAAGMAVPVADADAGVEKAVVERAEERAVTTASAGGTVPGGKADVEPQPRRRGPAKKTAASPPKE